MSDDYGNLMGSAADLAPAAMGAYMAYDRNKAFIQGAFKSGMGAEAGREIASLATKPGAGIVATAGAAGLRAAGEGLVSGGLRAAAVGAVRGIGAGIAEGAAAGSFVPGVGTVVGAALGAVAPFILPKIPVVGDVVNKVPLVGGMLSPKQIKQKTIFRGGGGGGSGNPNLQGTGGEQTTKSGGEMTQSGADYSRQQRAEYESGRGFR